MTLTVSTAQRAQLGKNKPHALERAVDLAMADIKKIQSRLTEELRAEDAVRGMSVRGGKVIVDVDGQSSFKPAGLRSLLAELLKKHGAGDVTVSLHTVVRPEQAVAAAQADVVKIQHRLTRDLRVEDGIAGLSHGGGDQVTVALKARQPYDEKLILDAVKTLLAAHGLKGAVLSVVRPAIDPIRPPAAGAVSTAWAAIQQVQHRLTADLRAEDDVLNLVHDGGKSVKIVLGAHPRFATQDIEKAVRTHLERAGLADAVVSFVRPAVDPIRPPVSPPSTSPARAAVDDLQKHLDKVHGRLTEELRIEDGVDRVKLVGAKVEVTLSRSSFDQASVLDFVKRELGKRGVQLPVVAKA